MNQLTDFVSSNWIELAGAVAALIYLFFSIRQNIWLWLCGITTSLFYAYVFAQSSFYADMALQIYYLVVSIYGWSVWLRGGVSHQRSEMPVVQLSQRMFFKLNLIHLVVYAVILCALLFLPDSIGITPSSLPYLDALTTSGAIVATWMLARKYIENWLVFIVVDFISIWMYVYKELYITAFLFVIYTGAAFIGYQAWKKNRKEAME